MTGKAFGKHKLRIEAYVHEKGKAGARITHIDLEGPIEGIIKPGEITFVRGKQGGAFIALKKPMIERAEKIIKKKEKDLKLRIKDKDFSKAVRE